MSDYYCCCNAKFGKISADMFYKVSSPCHNSISFLIYLLENVLAAIFLSRKKGLVQCVYTLQHQYVIDPQGHVKL